MPRTSGRSLRALFTLCLVLAAGGCASIPRALLLPTDPLTPREHVKLAAAYLNQKRDDLAEREYRAALKKEKKYAPALLGLGNLEFERGQWGKAEKFYRRALKIAPGDPGATNNLAMAYLKEGKNLDKAHGLIVGALETAGDVRPYLFDTLANLYLAQGATAEARRALDQAWAEGPQEDPQFKQQFIQTLDKFPPDDLWRLKQLRR